MVHVSSQCLGACNVAGELSSTVKAPASAIMQAPTANPEDLRRLFHQEIDRMEPSRLEILNRMLQQLRLLELADQIDRDFGAERAAGRLSPAKVAEAVEFRRF